MGGMSKLGLHIQNGYRGNLGKPRIVKLVDPSPEYIREVRALVGDGCALVVRWTLREQPLDNPAQNARDLYAKLRPMMVDPLAYYEAYNEIADGPAPQYAAFLVEWLRLMHVGGRRSAVGSWPVGVPDIPVWATYAPALAAMHGTDVLSLHEYWSHGADMANPWHVGRWRMVPEIAQHKIIVTECGRDVVEGRGYRGWHADGGLTANGYLRELREYNAICESNPNVLGATVFTAGQIVDAQWQPYEVNSLATEIVAEQGEPQSAPPVVTPQPEPPRVVMAIVNTGKAWYSADSLFGPYDEHPQRARDWNLESMGNTDLGEPLQAPCDGYVVYAANAGGGHGLVVSFVAVVDGELVNWHWKHLQRADVKQWQRVAQGQRIGAIGNAYGQYSAHLHEEVCIGAITGPTQDWRDPACEYVDPAEFYIAHGVDAALVDRMTQYDGR
jgi:murein DD-endopeptidase MepM/ murein hydrolase activator NlpD